MNRLHGIDSRLISPDEIAKLALFMQVHNPEAIWPIQGALCDPPGGAIRHDAVVWGFARGVHLQRRRDPPVHGRNGDQRRRTAA